MALLVAFLHSLAPAIRAEEQRSASPLYHANIPYPRPTVELPSQVPAPQGKVTLWADFAHAEEEGIHLYLVNRSGSMQSYSSQDNDLYIKLEYQNAAGKRLRAQTHLSSLCGNSYRLVTLPPGQFFAFYGYRPKEGKRHAVRYASTANEGLISNEGEGIISDEDLSLVKKDSFAKSLIPGAIHSSIYVDSRKPPEYALDWNRASVAVRLLKLMERNEAAIELVEKLKVKLESQPASERVKEARLAVDELLSYTWPEETKRDSLLKRCIKTAAEERPQRPRIGTLESAPNLLWSLLAEMLGDNSWQPPPDAAGNMDFKTMKPLMMAAARMVREGPKELRHPAASVLRNHRIADEVIPSSQFEEWLLSPELEMQDIAAKALSRRMEWGRLSELGMNLPPDRQLIVLQALAYSGYDCYDESAVARNPELGVEAEFWQHCLKTKPLDSAGKLWSPRIKTYNPFYRVFHDPLHDYLKVEAEKAAKITTSYDLGADGNKLFDAVELLGSWRLEEDLPIFKLLLKHPGTYYANLIIKRAAREALILQGQPIPGE